MLYEAEISVGTALYHHAVDITETVAAKVKESGVGNGIATVFSPHTTCTLILNENESGFLSDLETTMDGFAPQNGDYNHNCDRKNGQAHLQSAAFGVPSLTIMIKNGTLRLGEFQRIFLFELDGARARKVWLQVLGE